MTTDETTEPSVTADADQPWGRVDADATVWVRTPEGERAVGQYPGATAEAALAYFTRKFDELEAQVKLLEQRLRAGQVSATDAESTAQRLSAQIVQANAVGDLQGLLGRLKALGPVLAAEREKAQAAKQAAREKALAARAALVTEAEELAAPEANTIPWKVSGDRLRALFEEWKRLQRDSRLDKSTEDELWKRFGQARALFERKRRQYFSALDEQRALARQTKQDLIAQAQALATATDWGPTTGKLRDLMDRWKAAGRTSQKEDDTLWAQFKAAQDAFFAARSAANSEAEAEFQDNLRRKEEVLTEAEALLPVTDAAQAKAALRRLQDRWDEIGKVPRADMSRIDARMRAVEQAIRDLDQEQWRRRNPEAEARAQAMLQQLEKGIAGLQQDLAKAQARGEERQVAKAQEALAARQEWLAQVRRAQQEFTG